MTNSDPARIAEERAAISQALQRTITPEVYELLTQEPEDVEALAFGILNAAKASLDRKPHMKLPLFRRGETGFTPALFGYDAPRELDISSIADLGHAPRVTATGRRLGSYALCCEVVEQETSHVAARFSGTVRHGQIEAATAEIVDSDLPIRQIVGAGLAWTNDGLDGLMDLHEREEEVDLMSSGHVLGWRGPDGSFRPV